MRGLREGGLGARPTRSVPVIAGVPSMSARASPLAAGGVTALGRQLGIWRSAELHLCYRLRQAYREPRLLDEAPAHLFLDDVAADLVSSRRAACA